MAGLEKPYRELLEDGKLQVVGDLLYASLEGVCVIVIGDKESRKEVLRLGHDNIMAGHLNTDRTKDRVRKTAWWPGWAKDVEEWVESCDTCQRANKKTGKRFGLLQRIEDPTYPWEIINMDFVTGLPPAGDRSYNCCLVVVDRLSRRARFIATHKEVDAPGCALLFWKHIISEHGLPQAIISDRDPKFTSEIWKSLFKIMGTKLAMSTSYHPQTDGLTERMIQTLEDMLRRYCAFGIEYKDSEGFVHDWVSLLPALEFAYNSSTHSTTQRIPFELERGYTPRLPQVLINKDMATLKIHPGAQRLANMIQLARAHAKECIQKAFEYSKEKWDKGHTPSTINVGDRVMISTVNFTNLQGAKKLQDTFFGPFLVIGKHGPNAVEVELTPPFDRKHPTFPVSLLKLYKANNEKEFLNRQVKVVIPAVDDQALGEIKRIVKERITKHDGKERREYLVRFWGKSAEDNQWLQAKDIVNGEALLRKYRVEKRS